MRTTKHPPELLSLAEMATSVTGTETTEIPFCPPPCQCADCETYYYPLEQQKFDRFHYTGVCTNTQAKAILADYMSKIDLARNTFNSLSNGTVIYS